MKSYRRMETEFVIATLPYTICKCVFVCTVNMHNLVSGFNGQCIKLDVLKSMHYKKVTFSTVKKEKNFAVLYQ
jgi:hypothetical protein